MQFGAISDIPDKFAPPQDDLGEGGKNGAPGSMVQNWRKLAKIGKGRVRRPTLFAHTIDKPSSNKQNSQVNRNDAAHVPSFNECNPSWN